MTKLRIRCNRRPCRARKSIRNTPENRYKIDHHEIKCHMCDNGYMRIESRTIELSRRKRCLCDGVQWADTRNSPHDVNTPGCEHYEGRPGPDVPF